MKNRKFRNYNLDDLRKAVKDSICWSDVCRKVNVTICTYSFKRIQSLVEEYDISTSHFNKGKALRRGKCNWTEDEIFVENCSITRGGLRPALKRIGFYTGFCAECGNSDNWNGKPLTIEIDHKNGICTDNRKENLQWLCPNCHSQTSTYRKSNINRTKE